ncbi:MULTISPECIES: non-ribosomal peptide synthetase [unclassified Janthinobacterium]|uniref:non-ribosomal peptide synthetase n=1 Tax=unclassified Janthinobacterium TaxID=2610881 RepID=UPI00034B31CC|nr:MULTISPECIES: non-ribosomal peptide synthetase [unclassified Janthinobacterium]MEC5161348.1 amino acid adenylation domain-containing protein [Janthinobacterium sp. CG_S6]
MPIHSPSRHHPENFVAHLRALAAERPADTALIVVAEREGAVHDTPITYAALERRVRALAAHLQQRFGPGERALLLLDNNDHYVVSFFACLYAGLVAVPVFPPESAREQHLARLVGIAADAQAACILTSSDILNMVGGAMAAFAGVSVIAADQVDTDGAGQWLVRLPRPDDLAFLQYTSGSTSTPKGVMVTHGNLIANERAIEAAMEVRADDVFVSWLPLYHDMGLIGGLLQPFHRGIPVALLTPKFFLERPARWLEAIARLRGTVSGGPDFAFRLCLDRVKQSQLARLDLSSWRVAFSGAEPVRHDTLCDFIAHTAPAGFAASSVYPCYGLAEATLLLTGGRRAGGVKARAFSPDSLAQGTPAPQDGGAMLVSCGAMVDGHLLDIVDPHTGASAAAGAVGEIWASGPSIAQGYWRRERNSDDTFVERAGRRWLRTGDLGFLHDEQLYITGRIKDMIIVRGQNIYPQDIERGVEADVEAARKGRVAAFAVPMPDGGEGVGVAVEISRGLQKLVPVAALVEALSQAVGAACREPASVLVLLNPGALPKTSSGKLQRGACRKGWLENTLDAYAIHQHGRFVLGGPIEAAAAAALSDTETALAGIWRDVLKRDAGVAYARDAHFLASGGSSLAAVQVAARIGQRWDIDFPVRLIFEQPLLAQMADAVAAQLAGGARDARSAIAPLAPAQRQLPLPLSHAQQRLWFLWQMAPTSTAYHVGGALRYTGALDTEALRAGFDALVARHESLRTLFRSGPDGLAEQLIQNGTPLDWSQADLRTEPAGAREEQAARLVEHLNNRPFDLHSGPLLRAVLIRVGEAEHILAVVVHHIVSDGVSMQVLIAELAAHYRARLAGTAPAVAALPIQYADYAAWQQTWLQAGEGARQLAYWRQQLGGEQPVLSLPTDRARHPVAAYRAAGHSVELPAQLAAALGERARHHGATMFMALLAGFQVLLHRYTGQNDIRVGVPLANRQRIETEGLIGFFVNTQVLRNQVGGRTTLAQALAQAREAALGAQSHPDLPFEQLVDALQPERSLSHSPLFQVMFNHQRADYAQLAQLPGLEARYYALPEQAAQFELTLDSTEHADGRLSLRFIYAAELFDAATIARMADDYLAIVAALAAQPAQAVGDVGLVNQAEQTQLEKWGVNPVRHADAEPVHRAFERHAARRPDAPALVFGDATLSYAELNAKANRLAHHLVALGVRLETTVGIAVERSIDMVVGLLAILKSGATYVPLDTDYPAERLRYMIEDSGIGLLLTHSALTGAAAPAPAAPLRTLLLDRLDLSGESAANPALPVHGENLAYVIYTSGSTGMPKGASNRHRALSSCMAWMQETYQLTPADTVLHKAPFGFDVSVWELFWPLTAGARLALALPGDQRDPARLVALIQQHQVTTVNFVPAMLQAFLAHEGIEASTRLKHIICGGEAMPAETQRETFARLRQAGLHNLYGPTEAAIHVTHWACRDDGRNQVPIGRPISATHTYVLDTELNMVPAGVTGELYLGGVHLGRGYLRRAGLTSERFVADPFDPRGGRLYRTGDLVRWNGEGQLEYLGRIDHQVKIRGLRIELGEIEAQLLAQPALREAVVLAREAPGGKRLVAYVAAHEGVLVDAAALKAQLALRLPDYMVPRHIVALPFLPLNANGKVDRKALPDVAPEGRTAGQAPQGQLEETLAQIWCGLLELGSVGRHDSFFELGGHSLLLLQMQRRLAQQLDLRPTVVELFKYPTLEALAAFLRGGNRPARATQEVDERAKRQRGAFLQRKPVAERVPT